ncbi:MAG: L,D-transpeptidase family protein [Catonella sp.]|uniref:L,D-transpeptidase family protein n=1 Tax=Catonella sp. TaxID=2382125 RepID=UPI003FA1330E
MKTKKIITYLFFLTFLISSLSFINPVAAASDTYHIKVNRYTNTVTVYQKQKDGSYSPIKAMLCSTGGKNTPLGTFRTSTKYRWRALFGGVYGQYATRINGPILFHSIPYTRLNAGYMQKGEYEKLGTSASHGCVRLAVEDVKWIFDNCSYGTKVTIYSSDNPGSLGKPKAAPYKKYTGYDPTDRWNGVKPVPVITVPKKIVLSSDDYAYDLLKGVKSIGYDGQDITQDIEIEENIDFNKSGKYTIKYTITDKWGEKASASTTVILE